VVALFILLCCARIGEASNPGPPNANFAADFVLGIANPTGLRNKGPYVASQMAHGDVWMFSETHLSSRELQVFNTSLKFSRSPFKPMLGGFPVPDTSDNAGCWKGVGVLSRTPVRQIPQDWAPAISRSSRAMVFTTLVDDLWLTGGVVYGEPDSKLYPSRLENNEALLQAVVSTVGFLSTGPRVIAGDWNVSLGELPVFDMLRQAGFRDLQDVAEDRWGIAPVPTCKFKTRKDFCFISRELQDLLTHVSVINDLWPDHAVVQGHFQRLKHVVPHDVWRRPSAFPWPPHWQVDSGYWDSLDGPIDAKYMRLWEHFETTAAARLPFPVQKSMTGRAKTTFVTAVRPGLRPPMRVGRPGDFQPHFFGASWRHVQWVRQVRRLQSYMRCVQHCDPHGPHASNLWASIMRAKGFQGGFCQWWMICDSRVHGAPHLIPWFPPGFNIAGKIFESVALAVRSLETELCRTSKQYAKLRRAKNPNQIFRDLKAAPENGVDYLLQPLKAKIVEVRPDDLSIVVDPPQPWHGSLPIWCQGVQLNPIHVSDDCLWLQSTLPCELGGTISQLKCTGTKDDLAAAFIDSWKERWDRHRDVPASRWDTILSFAREKLPCVPMQLPSLTPTSLSGVISTKKATSAGGLDGVSVADLRSLPREALQNICSMFREIEATGSWPSQMLLGKVACLAKVEDPRTVMDYRPITVLGMLYRVWGSFYSHTIMKHLTAVLPDSLYGSRPACFAGQVWSQLLWAVEASIANGVALTGLIADLQKAFNHIPRLVVIEAAALLGIPLHVLRGWAGALAQVGRRFQLGPNLTESVFSVTGLPEGDGLSCVGMVIIDVLFHLWHSHFFPLCQPISYVDDWTVLTTSPALMSGIYACLGTFTDAVDLLLDSKKTFTWSVCSAGRKSLQSQGFRVQDSCRVLGAHVQTTRKHTNATQMARINSLQSLWPKLRLSAAPYGVKVRALRCAAWPRALHAIAATSVASQTFKMLRAAAMKSLQAEGSGCSSIVHLSLCEKPQTDPHFWTLVQTFRLVRDCGIADVVIPALQALVRGDGNAMANGITATLLGRLQVLGWHVNSDGCCNDDFGSFSLFDICLDELLWRTEWSWLKVVSATVRHRPGFADLDQIDPADTRRWLQSLNASDQALMRKSLNGAHITQDGKHHCQEVLSDVCLYCSCSDSRYHRFWVCPAFQQCRRHVSSQLWDAVPTLPECVVCHGWSLRPTTTVEWYASMAMVQQLGIPPCPVGSLQFQLFTDGSCFNPNYPAARFAAFAVVLAFADDRQSMVLDSGPLPGLRQTSVRAELFAVVRVVKFAAFHGVRVMIWSDCLSVVRRLRRVLQGTKVKINSPNADLWTVIADDLTACACDAIQITKVAAHSSVQHASSPFEEWCFRNNCLADKTAVHANQMRPPEFWQLLQRHVQACIRIDGWNAEIREVLLQVGRMVVRHEAGDTEEQCVPAPKTDAIDFVWDGLPHEPCLPPGAVRWYGKTVVSKMMRWFWDVLQNSTASMVWISYSQLYIDFAISTGEPGPLKFPGWCDGADIPHHSLLSFGFKQRTKWFGKVLRETLRHGRIPVRSGYHRPKSFMIAMHAGCLALPWPEHRLEFIDRWVGRFVVDPFRRQSKAMDSLPVPCGDLTPRP
jgi:ribonuclease HI